MAPKLGFGQLDLLAFAYLVRHFHESVADTAGLAQYVRATLTSLKSMDTSEGSCGSVVALGCAIFETTVMGFEHRLAETYGALVTTRPRGNVLPTYAPEQLVQLRQELGLDEEQIATLDRFNSSSAHMLFLTPVGKAIALSQMEQRGMIAFDWKFLLEK